MPVLPLPERTATELVVNSVARGPLSCASRSTASSSWNFKTALPSRVAGQVSASGGSMTMIRAITPFFADASSKSPACPSSQIDHIEAEVEPSCVASMLVSANSQLASRAVAVGLIRIEQSASCGTTTGRGTRCSTSTPPPSTAFRSTCSGWAAPPPRRPVSSSQRTNVPLPVPRPSDWIAPGQ